MTDKLNGLMAGALNVIYPQIVFDAQGLTALLLPCLLAVLAGLIIMLLMKLNTNTRRFAYMPAVIAMIVMIAASSFFPVTLKQAGDFTMQQLQQFDAQETEASNEPGT